ncbi:MAG: GTPase, partial [Sulfolobales archaeon]|nr:50S ribosome-binding GTPase [Sulfolobales archaeon]MDW8010883.1 GTPase [Sulfolobales archaeon]
MEERECPSEVLRKLPVYGEVREFVLKVSRESVALPRSVKKRALVKYRRRIDKISSYLIRNLLEPLQTTRKLLQVGFYNKIASNTLPSGLPATELVDKLLGKLDVVRRLSREYRSKLSVSFDVVESRELYREYVGRVLSVVRRASKYLELLNKAIVELRKVPCVDLSLPVVAVAGMPQVGKSTLVSAISTAKPRSSPFPFTTKEIVLGHVNYKFMEIQILDLPGILDRPPEDMNEVERKAFVAVTELSDLVLFLVDPSEDFYYGFEPQLSLLKSLKKWVGVDVLIVVNKVDKVSSKRLELVSRAIGEVAPGVEILKISALKRIGLEELVDAVVKHLKAFR